MDITHWVTVTCGVSYPLVSLQYILSMLSLCLPYLASPHSDAMSMVTIVIHFLFGDIVSTIYRMS